MSNPRKTQQARKQPRKQALQHKSSAIASPKSKRVAPTYSFAVNDKRWLRVLAVLSGVVLIALLFTSTQSGTTFDATVDGGNGKYSLKYYTEGDTSFANYKNVPEVNQYHMKYYGSGYEILPAIALKYFGLPPQHEWLFRNLLCAFFGFVLILFAALTARELKDSLLACITLAVMALSPLTFGWSIIDTKDIPHAAGYAIAIFALTRILKRLPRLSRQDVAMLTGGIALATSIRIGGLMLVGYLGVGVLLAAALKKQLREQLLRRPYASLCKVSLALSGAAVVGVLLGLCLYPNFFYEGPVMHVKSAFLLATNFRFSLPFLWEGQMVDTLNLPSGYLLKSFAITIPEFALGAFLLFFCNIRPVWKTMDRACVLLLLFTIFFPVAYILYKNAIVYNGWRHLTFIYSSFAVLAATGIYYTLFWVKRGELAKVWRCAFSGAVATGMAVVLVWMVGNYKYCCAYFNAFVRDPHLKYDMDYYETASIVALRWLAKHELKNRSDTVKVAVRNDFSIAYAKVQQYDNLQMERISYRSFAEAAVDYAILNTLFLPASVLNTAYPPKGVIHAERVGGKPICRLSYCCTLA